MHIDEIKNGIVLDHITAGKGLQIYRFLELDNLDAPVAIIQNAASRKMGKKDIIKIETERELNLDIIGYVDPGATVNVIRDGCLIEKKTLDLPETLTDVIFCKNPRCITSVEQELSHVFRLTDKQNKVYRCLYCETQAKQ